MLETSAQPLPMKTSLLIAATTGTGATFLSWLTQLNEGLKTIVLILTIVAWGILVALRVRNWRKNRNDGE